jgi:hypothetical protein
MRIEINPAPNPSLELFQEAILVPRNATSLTLSFPIIFDRSSEHASSTYCLPISTQ